MSKNEPLSEIEPTDLTRIHGGTTPPRPGSHNETVELTVTTPVGSATLGGNSESSAYQMCMAANERQARERHPDTRSIVGQIFNTEIDRNARARTDYERAGQDRCLAAIR